MESYLNYCASESWEQSVSLALGSTLRGAMEAPTPVKQRCQANARERDRTQKLVSYQAFDIIEN